MKINKQPKRLGPVHPEVSALINAILSATKEELPPLLSSIQAWQYPRSDLHAWSAVLNKFDEILEQIISDYEVDQLQMNDFTPSARTLLSEILRVEKVLLDNSTNRKIYASYDRLNALLSTTDLDILVLTLKLFLRPAQQYSSQVSLSQSLAISTPRLATLCMRFPTSREHNLELAALVSSTSPPGESELPPGDLHFNFYKMEDSESTAHPGLNVINIPGLAKDPKPAADIVFAAIQKHGVPDDDRFELLHRVRLARALGASEDRMQEREKLAVVRLLSIAIFCHTHVESIAQNSLFLPDPTLVSNIADCLHHRIPSPIQVAALAALDGLARYKGKMTEVMASINAGVSHGILMNLLRRVVGELDKAEDGKELTSIGLEGVEQLLSFVTYLASNSQGGNMIVGAGLIPLLVQIIDNKRTAVLPVVQKTMALVDNVLYGYTNAFSIWLNSRGLDVLVERIRYEVDHAVEQGGVSGETQESVGSPYGLLPYMQSMALKNFLRSMHRMMQSSGTSEGLRSLIDSSLSKSVKAIMTHRGLFGPHIFALSINIMATFIHNEPTSLGILQEQHVPETFYGAIALGVEPVFEVIQAIPNALGALCLNQAGQDMLSARPEIISGWFSIFTSDKHVRVLQDRENAGAVGTAMDELIRHHPALKNVVMNAIKDVFDNIESMAKSLEATTGWPRSYQLKLVPQTHESKEAESSMVDDVAHPEETIPQSVSGQEGSVASQAKPPSESPVVMSIDILGRFMDGLFQHTPHIRDFITKADGVDRICKLYTLPCLPEDFASSSAAEALVGALRLMAEVNPQATLVKVHEQVRLSLTATKEFWASAQDGPKLASMAAASSEDGLTKSNELFRRFVVLLGRLTFMADVYASISFSHGRSATTYLQTLASGNDDTFLEDLGSLHRCCILENVLLKGQWPSTYEPAQTPPADVSGIQNVTPSTQDMNLLDDAPAIDPLASGNNVADVGKAEDPLEMNRKSIKHLLRQIPVTVTTFFQAIVKMFLYSRRNVDTTQKKQASATASIIASILVQHLRWEPFDGFLTSSLYGTYATVMLGLVTILFFDERTSQNNLQTMLVVHFREAGGLQAILDISQAWATEATKLFTDDRNKETTQALAQVYGGLQVTLNLFEALVAPKPLFDSGQTALLTTRDKKPGQKDYFEPHDFLIKLRLELLPFMRGLWEAPWIVAPAADANSLAPPLGLVKSIVRIMQHVMEADSEERRVEPPVNTTGLNWAAGLLGLGGPRPEVVPDENRVQQLIDMGFPRHAVERALRRTGNNISAATEYLLTHPAALVPDPAPAPQAAPNPVAQEEDVDMENANIVIAAEGDISLDEGLANPEMADASVPSANPTGDDVVDGPVDEEGNEPQDQTLPESAEHREEVVEVVRDYKQELDAIRSALEPEYPKRALLIAEAHESLVFELKNGFLSSREDYGRLAFNTILDAIKEVGTIDSLSREHSLGVRCHLLALVLNQPTSTPAEMLRDRTEPAGTVLLDLLQSVPFSAADETLPRWLSSALLGVEAVLTLANEFTEPKLPENEEPIQPSPLFAGPDLSNVYEQLFTICRNLLGNTRLNHEELISVLRLLVLVTRERAYAATFVADGGLQLLLGRFKAPTKDQFGCQIYLMLILRHLVEDEAVLQHAMKEAVVDWFHQPRNRVVDATTLLKNVYMVALRDPELFLETAASTCQLQSPIAAGSGHHITLRPATKPKAASGEEVGDVGNEHASSVPMSESLETVVSYLVGELLDLVKVGATSAHAVEGNKGKVEEVVMKEAVDGQAAATPASDPPEHIYMCELMSWLTELVTSYPGCKVAFINHGKKRGGKDVVATPGKIKTTALNFVVQDLLFAGSLHPKPIGDVQYRLRSEIGIWAMSLITALCRDEFPVHESKELHPDLTAVRKAVLDAIAKAIRDTMAVESQETKYNKLHAVADLCHHLLVVRPGTNSKLDDASIHIAKLMLEKNFVSILTGTLADVDLNYPHVKTLVNSILRPLEQLTRVAIKMGRASEKDRDTDHVVNGSHAVGDQAGAVPREETPDLYRNSALGIFGGEMEEMYDEDDIEDEEEGEDEDMEIEFEDEDSEGSALEDDADIEIEEEVDDDGQMADGSDASEEEWEDENLDEEEEMVEEEGGTEEEDEESGEDSEEGEEEEAEMMWQENNQGLPNVEDVEGEDAEDDTPIPVQLLEEDALPNDEEDGSEVADFNVAEEIGLLEPQFLEIDGDRRGGWRPALQAIQATGAGGDLPQLFPPMRRGRMVDGADDEFLAGRSRNSRNGIFDFPHPLLVDPVGSLSQASSQNRSLQRRGVRSHGPFDGNGLFINPTLESLGDAVNMLGQLLSRGRGDATEAEFSGPLAALFGGTRDNTRHHSARRHISSQPNSNSQRQERERSLLDEDDFGATSSIHRWQEEAALAQGHFAVDRAQRLSSHLVLRLLPAARETAAREAEAAEKARLEEEAKRAEEAAHVPEMNTATRERADEDVVVDEPMEAPSSGEGDMPEVDDEVASAVPQESDMAVEDRAVETVEVGQTVSDALAAPSSSSAPVADASVPAEQPEEAAPESSSASTRITVLVHGNPVDITDTGIDPTFLEALPDDMREEVLNQHFREHRTTIPQELPRDSAISAEFLDALPEDIRAEILQQDAAEQRRAARQAAAAASSPTREPAGPVDMDAATFFATLDPQLRSVVLLEQEDGLLQTLPSSIMAEANDLRMLQRELLRQRGPPARMQRIGGADVLETANHKKASRDAIQLLDKAGIATLVRLLFYPQLLRKNYLHKILGNICENGKTRAELLGLLLNILQDGTGDLVSVDKAFAQLSVRTTKSPTTPKSATKTKGHHDVPGISFALPAIPGENVPGLIAQRSIEALSYIANANEQAAVFFLSEQETPLGLRRSSSKKGKGKERQSTSTKYPIVVLLGLLDRQTMLATPSLMDAVAALLALITRPLTSLEVKESSVQPPPASNVMTDDVFNAQTAVLDSSDSLATGAVQGNAVVPLETANLADDTTGTPLLSHPPLIPHHVLRLIVNILTVGECSSRTFQQTLALITHVSHLADAKDIIASELRTRAQSLGSSLFADLDDLAKSLDGSKDQNELQGAIVAKFSPASSDQAKLLRILKTIDYMFQIKKTMPNGQVPPPPATEAASTAENAPTSVNVPSQREFSDSDKVYAIYEGFRFTPLWQRLGDCLAIVEDQAGTEHIATVLLPLIESLMVVCKYVAPKHGPSSAVRIARGSTSPQSPITPRESMEDLFVTFTDAHRKMLNVMVRNNPSLMSGSFALLVQNPRVLDFDNKRNYFNQQLHKRPHSRDLHQPLQLNIRRARVFEDSFQYLQRKTGDQIKYGKLSIRFYDEEGVDAGGVTREWFQILARQMFNADYALFQPCAADRLTYQPNRASWINPEHLLFFKFVGRIIGKAIYDGRLLDAHFARSFYRQLLGKPVDYRDVEWVDPEYYNSLCWILENDPAVLDLTFSLEAEEFGQLKMIPLKSDGDKIPVTNENKREYVQLAAQQRLVASIKEQIDHLLLGFFEIIPKDLITIFNEQEVELLISGTPDIDVDEWRAATDYNGYVPSDPVIVWWWRALKSFSREERAKMLAFVTGTSRVPLDGFNALQGVQGVQRFSIHKAYGDPDRLPQAHTCFNQIDLPSYTSYEKLRTQLLLAINEGGEGFGFA